MNNIFNYILLILYLIAFIIGFSTSFYSVIYYIIERITWLKYYIVFLFLSCIFMFFILSNQILFISNEDIIFDDAVAFGLNSIVCSGTLG